MNDLLKSELFKRLSDSSQEVSNDEMRSAYETFVKDVKTLNQSETDFQRIFRKLNITRIEFKILQAQNLSEQGENGLKNLYCQKVIWYIESEIDLLKLIFSTTLNNPSTSKSPKFKIYFIPKPKEGLGIDSMRELAMSFEFSHQFVNEKGQPVPFIHIAQTLETAFNFSFGDAYKSKERVFKRKPYNLTRALYYLKNLIIRANQKQDEKR